MVSYLRWLGCTATSRCWQVLATKLPQRPSADRRSYTPPLGWCSLQTNIVMVIQMNCVAPGWWLCVTVFATHRSFERTEPPPELGRSHRVNLLLRTARKRSWPPGNRQNIHINAKSGTSGSASTSTSPSVFYLHVRLSGNVVLEILHWADQERNVTGQNLEKAKPTQTTKTEKDGRGNTLKYL